MLQIHSPAARALFAALVVFFVLFLLFPIYWMIVTALKPEGEIFVRQPALWPAVPTLANFERVLTRTNLVRFLKNSVVTAGGSAILTTLLAALAAYGFAKFTFALRRPLMLLMISAQMFPFAVLLISLYPMLKEAGLLNTRLGLVISYIVFALPTGVYMLYTFFARIPSDLIEAARIDGASEIEILRRIVLPLSLPGLIAVAVYAFMWAWNDLFYALTIMTSNELRTVGPGLLLEFFGEMQQDWGGAMAASLLASMPVVLVFALLQRFFVEGLTAGAVKA
jgi:multiple sugar transport system permease protein